MSKQFSPMIDPGLRVERVEHPSEDGDDELLQVQKRVTYDIGPTSAARGTRWESIATIDPDDGRAVLAALADHYDVDLMPR